MIAVLIFNAFDLVLYGIATALSFMPVISYFLLGKKKEGIEKRFNYAFSGFFICQTLAFSLLAMSYLFAEG